MSTVVFNPETLPELQEQKVQRPWRRKTPAFTASVVRSPAGLTSVLRAVVRDEGGRQRVEILPHGTADQLSSILAANALAVIDPDVEMVSAGGALVCWLLDRD